MIIKKDTPDKAEDVDKLLHPLVKKWFYSRFSSYSLPQLYGVSEIHARKNILICAPTGATKTLTAFLSILNELVDSAKKGILEDRVYCVYVSPLKALNEDIKVNLLDPLKEINELAGSDLGIRVHTRTGDTTAREKSKMLKKPPHILITTPESLAILLASIKFSDHLKGCQWMIVDEIHSLAENKRGVHLSLSMERLEHASGHLTRVGLSATVAPLEDIAHFLVGVDRDCTLVDVQYIKEMDLKVLSPVADLATVSHKKLQDTQYKLINDLIHQHRTTLIFTNTRAGTERVVHELKERYPGLYYELGENPPQTSSWLIGAHHGSLSKEHRFDIEKKLRDGKLKCVTCSTSLELGLDIGYIDLVILLGSPKSVARALQRIGRSGHQLHSTTKGRIIVLDRDDLVECSVLLKNATERKIDRIHIPTNCLDVLVQHIHGAVLHESIKSIELYEMLKKSYCYRDLSYADFLQVVDYLAGKFVSLEDRHIYAKIGINEETGKLYKRGRMSRVIHMQNIGTIPDQSGIVVKIGEHKVGVLDESFLERLKPGDVFVLGGNTYQFKFSRGQVAQVRSAQGRNPTVPSWFSQMLPLSFDLAMEIGKFRRLLEGRFVIGESKKEIIAFILEYLYVDENAANSIYSYMKEQYDYLKVLPSDKKILIEHTKDEKDNKYIIVHTIFGRRVNDCLSRALAFAISRTQHRDVEIGITDYGFYVTSLQKAQIKRALRLLKSKDFDQVLWNAVEKTEVLKRRFRHCAGRALMILRNYAGRTKRVGRQQVSSMILYSAVKRISPNFFIIREARREVLEDIMDVQNTKRVLTMIENNAIQIVEINSSTPSPFSFNLILQSHADLLRMEERRDFAKRMHTFVQAKISLGKR